MLKKKFLKTKSTCQVTFQLPQEVEAKKASVVGEFNNWDQSATPLKKAKQAGRQSVAIIEG